ncbi:MAG: hypothetical protein HYX86_01030 [Chloroflexi bacterium]|nr:hypothetical protein [Chloroflexota bacterium]
MKKILVIISATTFSLAFFPEVTLGKNIAPSPILNEDFLLLASVLGWLLPLGLVLLAVGASPEEQAKRTTTWGLAAIPIAILAYALLGFGFQFGGLGLVSDLPGAENLRREWSPLDLAWGPGWGLIGLDAFNLLGGDFSPGLFIVFLPQVPLLAGAVVIATTSLAARIRFSQVFILALFTGALFYPILGNWIWGGGWLSQLGHTVSLGHGTIDFGGAITVFGLGATLALVGILVLGVRLPQVRGPVAPPPVHFPLLATIGTFFVLVGSMILALGNPLLPDGAFNAQVGVNIILAALGGLLMAALYTWFVTGNPDQLMTMRGAVAGLVGSLVIGQFAAPWAALLLGALVGVLLPFVVYFVEQKLRWEDPTAGIATFLMPALLGFVFLGVFADGRQGAGWNGVGTNEYLGVPGQGVSGLWVAPGFQPTPGQLYAQLVALGALLLIFLFAGLFFKALARLGMPTSPPPLAAKRQIQAEPAPPPKPPRKTRSLG